MALKVYPVKFEAYDGDTGDCLFKVEEFDEASSNVTISTVVDSESWPEISQKILECLIAIKGQD